ncbi:hypothetical protein ACFUJR_06650 [Streptomyces sp. NPDC057271]|uniref:hypothetical protein n=1 Tax=unclassified Streptomyces TaxID=2593676 RepID=UPI0036450E60
MTRPSSAPSGVDVPAGFTLTRDPDVREGTVTCRQVDGRRFSARHLVLAVHGPSLAPTAP